MTTTRRDDSLSTRIRGITLLLESGDGGVRRDLDAALAEVDALEAQAANYRRAGEALREARSIAGDPNVSAGEAWHRIGALIDALGGQ
jgi:hypothetical protein